jgi:alpha-1,2-mannosyltransferase
VFFVACPQWWFPHGANRELHWAFWEQAAGAAYVAFAAGVLLLSLRIRPGEGSPGARSNAPFRKELDSSGRNRQLQGLTH